MRYFWVIMLVLLLYTAQAQECAPPDVSMPESFIIPLDLTYTYNLTQGLIYSAIPLNSTAHVEVSDSTLIVDPDRQGYHTLLLVASDIQGCHAAKKIAFEVLPAPDISYVPISDVRLREGKSMTFLAEGPIDSYEWYVDGNLISREPSFTLQTNYSQSGIMRVHVMTTDRQGFERRHAWQVSISDVNRPPYVRSIIPDLVLREDTDGRLLNLYSYFGDPDNDPLDFFVQSGDIKLYTDERGDLYVSSEGAFRDTEVHINATDPQGESASALPFMLTFATEEPASYIGGDEACPVDIVCDAWSACLPEGISVRRCSDANACDDTQILESRTCDYNATCMDMVLNQGEEQVDCGGPCAPCPTCSDGIQNQQETGIDCGGPCNICPTCFDRARNQDETDIDCGGQCDSCTSGESCNIAEDCLSGVCRNQVCVAPTCHDGVINQGEEKIDCGGPCISCPSCDDGVKNQGEVFVDCAGPCGHCALSLVLRLKVLLMLLVFLATVFSAYMVVRKRYEKDTFGTLLDLFDRFSFFPNNIEGGASTIIETNNRLNEIKEELYVVQDKGSIAKHYIAALDNLFEGLLGMESISEGLLQKQLSRRVKNPFLRRLFMEIYHFGSEMDPDAPLFRIEMSQRIDETIMVLNEIRRRL